MTDVAGDTKERMTVFRETGMGQLAAGVRCTTAGEGPAVVVLLVDEPDEPSRFHVLLARQAQLFLVRMDVQAPGTAAIGDVLAGLGVSGPGRPGPTLVCRGGAASAGMRFTLDCPHAVSALVLIAPEMAVTDEFAALERPVLVLEGTRSETGPDSVGQRMAALLPECYDVLVYDATAAMDTERPDAVAEVVGDFVARGGGFIVAKPTGPIHP